MIETLWAKLAEAVLNEQDVIVLNRHEFRTCARNLSINWTRNHISKPRELHMNFQGFEVVIDRSDNGDLAHG